MRFRGITRFYKAFACKTREIQGYREKGTFLIPQNLPIYQFNQEFSELPGNWKRKQLSNRNLKTTLFPSQN
jgi:hypothetical protein